MAKRKANRLTESTIKQASDGMHADGDGLNLQVAKGGTQKSWVLRVSVDGKAIKRGLGSYPAVSLAQARESAAGARSELKQGREPVRYAEPEPVRVMSPQHSGPTFRDCAEKVIALRLPTWKSSRHAQQWNESLTNHVYPHIGDKPVAAITAQDVLDVVSPIWTRLPETSTRVNQRVNAVMTYAVATGLRQDNPAAAVQIVLPRRPRQKGNHAALSHERITECVGWIRDNTGDAATRLALEFLILTAARAGEVRGATWAEIDLDRELWTVPAARMKGGREHRVPLSGAAMDVLRQALELSRGNPSALIFPSRRKGTTLSNMAFTMMLRRSGFDCTTHGFRATFRTWALEHGYDWAVCERALAHKLGGSEVEAYTRGDLLDQRRELMQSWADYIVG